MSPCTPCRFDNVINALMTCGVMDPPALAFCLSQPERARRRPSNLTLSQSYLGSLCAVVKEGSGTLSTHTKRQE